MKEIPGSVKNQENRGLFIIFIIFNFYNFLYYIFVVKVQEIAWSASYGENKTHRTNNLNPHPRHPLLGKSQAPQNQRMPLSHTAPKTKARRSNTFLQTHKERHHRNETRTRQNPSASPQNKRKEYYGTKCRTRGKDKTTIGQP